MKKKLWMVCLLCIAAAALFAGCSNTVTRSKLDKQYADSIKVVFDVGEDGSIMSQENVRVYYYYEKDASGAAQVVEPGKGVLKDTNASKTGYFLEGWYTSPDYTKKWDFSRDKATEDITLYAKWLENFRYDFYYTDWVVNEETGVSEKKDILLMSETTPAGGKLLASVSNKITREGYTLLGLYSQSDCAEEHAWDYDFRHTGKVENGESVGTSVAVYTKWIEGNYTLVRSPSDFLAISSGGNFWLMNDIDFTSSGVGSVSWNGVTVDYRGTIEGNGYTVRGITAQFPLFGTRTAEWGIFKSLRSGAKIRNITFEDVVLTVNDTLTTPKTAGLLAGVIESGVAFENVTLSGSVVLADVARPDNYALGLIAGRTASDLSGITCMVDIDNRLADYDWHVNPADENKNEVVFVRRNAEA